MQIYVDLDEVIAQNGPLPSYTLLDEKNGCVAGCRCGVTVCKFTEYGKGGAHEDQEGFFVLSGEGMMKVGDEEFPVHAGRAYMAPAGVRHWLKSNSAEVPVKVFWFHSAV